MAKTESEWDARFGGALDNSAGGTLYDKYGEDIEVVKAAGVNRVWSVIEGENDNQYLFPGFHIVNLMGYVISEKPITEEELASGEWDIVVWFDGSELNRIDEGDYDGSGPRL